MAVAIRYRKDDTLTYHATEPVAMSDRPLSPKTERLPPPPEQRLPLPLWHNVKRWLLEHDPDAERMLTWSTQGVGLPQTAEAMAREIVWIILGAGRSAQAARTIEKKVWIAIRSGRPAVDAFGYRAKAAAIDRAWRERETDFAALQQVGNTAPAQLLAWCRAIPFVGDDTQYQLAKNFGADVCKPDIWLCRLAGIADSPRQPLKVRFASCLALCRYLATESRDRIATVDSLLWLACNKGVLQVTAEAKEVLFVPRVGTRSIYVASA